MYALGASDVRSGWLEQRALAHFTSFLLLFATCSVFLYCFIQIYRVIGDLPNAASGRDRGDGRHFYQDVGQYDVPWRRMLVVVSLLVANFLLLGRIAGFSILLCTGVLVSVYSLFDPMLGRLNAR